MPLPVTITGLATSVCPGPFKSSAGNYYLFGIDLITATTLQAYKATAPDVAWASVAVKTGFTTAILGVSGFQVGDIIHLAVTDGTGFTSVAHKYLTFNMATDAFGTVETIYAAQNIKGAISTGYGAALVVRSSGEVVALFNGAQIKSGKLFFARVYFSRRTAPAVWSAAVEVDAGGTFDYCRPNAVLGLSDAVHLLFTDAVNSGKQRTLSAANVLQTASSIALGALPHQPPRAISYLSGGIQKVVVASEAGNTSADAWHFDSGNTPVVVRLVVNNTTAQVPPVRVFNDGTDVYLVYRDNAADLQLVKSTDNAVSFGSPTNIFTGSVANADTGLSVGNVYGRGASIVLPYLVVDGGALKYNEWPLRLVANTGTLTTVEAGDVAALAGASGSTGTLAATENLDTAAFAGSGVIPGTLATTETPDIAALAGNVGSLGILAATEASDISVLAGTVGIAGTLTVVEAPDVAALSGPATIFGSIGAFEAPDIARLAGIADIEAVLIGLEAPDIVALTGNAGTQGVLAATESFDVAGFAGSGVVSGFLVSVEAPDSAAFAGLSGSSGVLTGFEAADSAVFAGDFKIATGTLAAFEAPDIAAFAATVINNAVGVLAATEAADSALILGFKLPLAPEDQSPWDYGWYQREPIRRHG